MENKALRKHHSRSNQAGWGSGRGWKRGKEGFLHASLTTLSPTFPEPQFYYTEREDNMSLTLLPGYEMRS